MTLHHEVAGSGPDVVAGTAHVPHVERPAEFDALVLDFLAGARVD